MKRHQVLTGAANHGEDCFGVGSIDGLHFTAYAAGCNIVILDSDFERLQIIPGATYGNVQISCIDCSSGSGKISGSYGKKVYIFVPVAESDSTNKLDKYKWVKSSEISTECDVQALSWNQDGSKLLTGGSVIQLWQHQVVKQSADEGSVLFFITEDKIEDKSSTDSSAPKWICVWHARPANSVQFLKFSSDSLLFASAGSSDRLVRVWYQQGKIKPGMVQRNRVSPKKQEVSYCFALIAHPRAVTGFSWRRISKYITSGSVANMLITSCKDNICRLWCETILPNDELVDSNQVEPDASKTHGEPADFQKKQFMQRMHHVRHITSKRRKSTAGFGAPTAMSHNVGNLENKHDNHKFGVFPSNLTSGFHFHLAASINPETDIPLIPTLTGNSHGFIVHWLNNKELHFTAEAEQIAQQLMTKSMSELSEEDRQSHLSDSAPGLSSSKKQDFEDMGMDRILEDEESSTDTTDKRFGSPGQHDLKIEHLLRDWHHSPDLLFSIHPVDGSYLVWLVDWLDEHDPGTFRQAQVSFSTRIPNALPKGDAMTMSSKVCLYSDHSNCSAQHIPDTMEKQADDSMYGKSTQTQNSTRDPIMPNLRLLTKHFNGSLNMWQVSFAEASKFTALLNISHSSRVSGHRFHTNTASCHPVMPLLVTTSHHNILESDSKGKNQPVEVQCTEEMSEELVTKSFCSELILWQVAAVGPLSKSGGLSELSRMNSPSTTAFTDVAWVPTLLPGSTLGLLSNSPSALFVAYDGCCLRTYQALIDARSVLFNKNNKGGVDSSSRSSSTGGWVQEGMYTDVQSRQIKGVNIVSEQSTARPGCIIEHEPITEATGDWTNVQLMHIFQEQLVTGKKTPERKATGGLNVIVFEEHFFLVVLQKSEAGHSVLHMWKMVIASEVPEEQLDFSPDVVYSQEDSKENRSHYSGSKLADNGNLEPRRLSIYSKKLCAQPLDLPVGVTVTNAEVAAGHLSSSSIYPACYAPYLLTTGCTDSAVRFWKCTVQYNDSEVTDVHWQAWEMISCTDAKSDIALPARPVAISCAYSGRVAVAYCKARKLPEKDSSKSSTYSVSVYECESTGGAEWSLEDTIHLKGVRLGSSSEKIKKKQLLLAAPHIVDVPAQNECSPPIPVQQNTLELNWVSAENGSHILTVCTGTRINFYTAVSSDVAAASKEDSKMPVSKRMVQKNKAMIVQTAVEELQWICIRTIELKTADGLVALPKHMSWVRDGILVVGMENEMHVYSQWFTASCEPGVTADLDETDQRALIENKLKSVLSSSNLQKTGFKMSPSVSGMKSLTTSSPQHKQDHRVDNMTREKSMSKGSSAEGNMFSDAEVIQENGMFEIARRANPVLPQYHPKQLFELLNFGKMKQVKAILAHLVRCISGKKMVQALQTGGSSQVRHRTASVGVHLSGTGADILPEEMNLDYIEIASIPPLPLYALINVDSNNYTGNVDSGETLARDPQDYSTLFKDDPLEEDAFEAEDADINDQDNVPLKSEHGVVHHHFGPSAAALLAKHLTHTQLPGLSSLDQMYLLALADTVANTKLEFSDSHEHKGLDESGAVKQSTSTEQIDDCGLRYVLAARHHIYLLNTLPLRQRVNLQRTGLSQAYFIWAFHSESCEELLNVIPSVQKGEPTWQEMKQFGVGWWVKNVDTLRKCIEKVAKHAFQEKQEPLDAAIFYLAMKKKNVLWGLFRSIGNTRMEQFFKNNFNEERWRKAALKNAFQLLGKQRFHHAAAFFLLAGAIRDAVEVCLNKLDDIQLCIVITRLYENEPNLQMPQNLKRLLYEECLGCDQHGTNYDPMTIHSDPFVRSMSYWIMKDFSAALDTLLDYDEKVFDEKREDVFSTNPTVFNFYNYLRSHPLVIRQKLTDNASFSNQAILLTGFPGSTPGYSSSNENTSFVNKLSPIERRLYFKSAHSHFKSGCPMLALEVLSKLPEVIDIESYKDTASEDNKNTLDEAQQQVPNETAKPTVETALDFDWSQPVSRNDDDELELKWSDDSEEEESDTPEEAVKSEEIAEKKEEFKSQDEKHEPKEDAVPPSGVGDIMAHQLKFIACMKILMEELATLATGFEVDGGQLRFQLYIWLEQEVEVLKKLCNYAQFTSNVTSVLPEHSKDALDDHCQLTNISVSHSKPTLHEIILAEKQDFEKKLARAARRKTWLQVNQQLLRTFLSYSVLHGSGGGGLASVRMELILLLQELQQEKMQQQLLSPLPFPTTLPLLSACVASAKSVVADPVHHLQSVIQDLLHTVTEFRTPPNLNSSFTKVFTMRDVSAALSACIYQSLCDSDSFIVAMSDCVSIGMEGFTSTDVVYRDSYLMAGANTKRRTGSISEEVPNSEPVKWPGVSSLRSLISKQQDDDCPRVHILLCESLLAVYMSLFIYALSTYECNILYRLTAHTFSETMWASIFGGGMKKLVHVAAAEVNASEAKDELSKQRMKLHLKVLGASGNKFALKEDKPTFKEKFVPPQVSIVSYLMTKPYENPIDIGVDYDSTESFSSSDEEEDSDQHFKPRSGTGMSEHTDTQSYSWSLMRYACVKYIRHRLTTFLPKVGLELPELPVCSPLLHSVLKCIENWEQQTKAKLDLFSGPPVDYIPGCYVESAVDGPTIRKYKALMDPMNTPFTSSGPSAQSAKRLWHFLVKQEYLQEVFIRYIYKKGKIFTEQPDKMKVGDSSEFNRVPESPMKIIHKEQEPITSFCMNQANLHCISVATQKEVIEMDIKNILNPPVWLEDETEYDIEDIKRPNDGTDPEDFLLVETPQDSHFMNAIGMPPTAPGALPAPSTGTFAGHTGRGAGVMFIVLNLCKEADSHLAKRKMEGIKRMGSHPNLPYYLSGGLDGSVLLWEWGHLPSIAVARQPGSFPKVTKVLFNAHGNKFGVSDGEGSLCLWQVGLGISMSKPYLSLKCHNRQTSDFVFVGSSSLLAAAGHSSDSQNVGLWDTLLPQHSALVQGFQCHSEGSPAILYAPQHQILISGGKRGEVCIFDVRQRQLRHSFQAHETAIKCLALDSMEKYFVTGSADGDIKVWGLDVHNLVHSFPGQHLRGSLFRNMGSGVTSMSVTPDGHLFSCGADGSLKVRYLPQKATSTYNSVSSSSATTPGMERRFTLASLTEFAESTPLTSLAY